MPSVSRDAARAVSGSQCSLRSRSLRGRATALAGALVLVLCSCMGTSSESSGTGDGTLRIGMSEEVLTLDIPNYRSTQDIMVGAIGLETLIRMDANSKLHPLLATSWKEINRTTYNFRLRSGVTFHDGTPFNATSVKKFFDRAKSALKGERFYAMIDMITTKGDNEVTFHLKQPFSPFLGNLAYPTGGIQSPASMDKYNDQELARHPVGTGPYQLSSWNGNTITYKRYDRYWNGKPPLNRIVLQYIPDDSTRLAALKANEIDVDQNPPLNDVAKLKKDDALQVFEGPRAQDYMLTFNHKNPALKNEDVRRAIAMAIDKKQLVDGVSEGIPRMATGFVPPELVKMSTKPIPYDPAEARRLLAKAGYPNGMKLDLWTPTGIVPNDVEMCENIQAQLAKVGIKAKVVNKEYAAYADGLARHEQDLAGLAWAHTGSPDSWYRGVFQSKSAANWSAYSNPRADALIDAAVQAPTYEESEKIWRQLDQLLVDDVAAVPIYWSTYDWAASSSVKGFGYHPLGFLQLNTTKIQS